MEGLRKPIYIFNGYLGAAWTGGAFLIPVREGRFPRPRGYPYFFHFEKSVWHTFRSTRVGMPGTAPLLEYCHIL